MAGRIRIRIHENREVGSGSESGSVMTWQLGSGSRSEIKSFGSAKLPVLDTM